MGHACAIVLRTREGARFSAHACSSSAGRRPPQRNAVEQGGKEPRPCSAEEAAFLGYAWPLQACYAARQGRSSQAESMTCPHGHSEEVLLALGCRCSALRLEILALCLNRRRALALLQKSGAKVCRTQLPKLCLRSPLPRPFCSSSNEKGCKGSAHSKESARTASPNHLQELGGRAPQHLASASIAAVLPSFLLPFLLPGPMRGRP